jgi:DNA-binding response OmpR family regulator
MDLNFKNSRNKPHILVVECEELLGEGLCCGLRHYNYSVDWVKDDLSAWPLLLSKRFDVIILDLDLLRMLGEDLLKNIRLKNITTPIIVMSSCDDIHNRVRSLDLGADYVSNMLYTTYC